MRIVLAVLLVLGLLAAPLASAHTQATATAPTAPIKPFANTSISVDLGAECVDTYVGVPPSQSADRHLTLATGAPAGFTATGETVTLPASGCANPTDPGTSHKTGTLLLHPDGTIPAFADQSLAVACEECEGGTFKVQVAYYANVTGVAPAGLKVATPFTLTLNVSTNFDTDLRISATDGSKVTLGTYPSEVRVESPLVAGSTSRLVDLQLTASAPAAGWTTDQVVLTVAPLAHGKTATGTNVTIPLNFTNDAPPTSASTTKSTSSTMKASGTQTGTSASNSRSTSGSSTNSTSDKGSKDSPPASPFLALAVVAVALVALRRRRA